MKRRTLIRKAAVGSLVTAGIASAAAAGDDVGTDACYFECCEDCEKHCPDGKCTCEYYCNLEP